MSNYLIEAPYYLAFRLASVLTSYPDASFEEYTQALIADLEPYSEVKGSLWKNLQRALMEQVLHLDDLRSAYIDIFDRGHAENPIYETEYGRDQVFSKTTELADLGGFYRAFGLQPNPDGSHEMLDHVSVELEFYAELLLKQMHLTEEQDQEGVDIVADARCKFLRDHIGRFMGAIAERPGVTAHSVYAPIFQWCRFLVATECQRLNVEPESLSWDSRSSEPEAIRCGVLPGIGCPSATS